MKIFLIVVVIISLLGWIACNSSQPKYANTDSTETERAPLTTVEEAITYVETNFKNPEETLWIADALNDNIRVEYGTNRR